MIGVVTIHRGSESKSLARYYLGAILPDRIIPLLKRVLPEQWKDIKTLISILRNNVIDLYDLEKEMPENLDDVVYLDIDADKHTLTYKDGDDVKTWGPFGAREDAALDQVKEEFRSYYVDDDLIEEIYMRGFDNGKKNKDE